MQIGISDADYTCGIFDSSHSYPDVSVTRERAVTCYEIELYVNNGGVTYADGVPHQIRKGRVLCVKPGCVRYSELPLKTYYVKISENAECLRSVLDKLGSWFSVNDWENGQKLILAMLEARASGNSLLCHSKLLEFLSWLSTENDRAARIGGIERQKSREAVSLAMEYMEANFREKCTLEEVAEHVHLSPVYFHGIFRTAVGKSPYEYVTRLRIEEAKRLLLTAGLSMAEVSDACGFSTQSYFNHVFRARVGMTPRDYRRQMLVGYFDIHGVFKDK
jgi:AraC-like DNA-binding protein